MVKKDVGLSIYCLLQIDHYQFLVENVLLLVSTLAVGQLVLLIPGNSKFYTT